LARGAMIVGVQITDYCINEKKEWHTNAHETLIRCSCK